MKKQPVKIALEKQKKLSEMELPSGEWSVVEMEVRFIRKGQEGEWASVVYDASNDTFYVKTNKAIVYPGDEPALQEALDLMKRANKVINAKQ